MGHSTRSGNESTTGRIAELIFAAECESRGCTTCFPGGGVKHFDIVVITPTARKLVVQVKGQATEQFRTVDLRSTDHGPVDLLAVFNGEQGGWFLLPEKILAGRRTINISEVRKHPADWNLIK